MLVADQANRRVTLLWKHCILVKQKFHQVGQAG